MTRSSALRLAFVFSAIAVLAVIFAPRKSVLHAQAGCDATTFNGPYVMNLTGSVYDNQGYVYLLASVGRVVLDGAGNASGSDTFSFDGNIVHRSLTGTYSVNNDCTGSMTLQSSSTNIFHGDIVATNNGNQIHFVQTDSNYILSGTFSKQNPAPATVATQ